MQKKIYTLYMHENKVNGKCYIGITSQKNINKRWQNGYGYRTNNYFYSAIVKYGWDNFDHYILLENQIKSDVLKYEILLITALGTTNPFVGYNITKGGEGISGYHHTDETKLKLSKSHKGQQPMLGHKHTDETKAKMKESRKDRIITEETKEKISLARKSWNPSIETRNRMSESAKINNLGEKNPMYGKNHTLESKFKNSESHKGKKLSDDHKQKIKDGSNVKRKVYQYELNGILVNKYETITEASIETKSNISGIVLCCQGNINISNGFIWRYSGDSFNKYKLPETNKVIQFDKQGNVINIFDSIKDAANYYNVDYSAINKCCRGVCKTTKGFIWKYANDCNDTEGGEFMPKQNFICTSDKSTADELLKLGFKLLKTSSDIYTFANDVMCNFEYIDQTKIIKTNQLTF